MARIIIISLFLLTMGLASGPGRAAGPPAPLGPSYLVGAYFYTWYPQNFQRGGHLRQFLKPPQKPRFGYYHSDDRRVLEEQIALCSRYGIDFLAVDYWPRRDHQNQPFLDNLLSCRNLNDIRFCLFFETHNLGFDRGEGWVEFTPQVIAALKESVAKAAKYFGHPRYLRVNGRPVLMMYLTRNFFGQVEQAMAAVREEAKKLGHDLYLIGDEVFWKVTGWGAPGHRPAGVSRPVKERIRLFDAITAYNMYEGGNLSHAGFPAHSRHLPEVAAKYLEYIKACGGRTAFVPNIMPGYNDRGVRVKRDHYAIPRQWEKGAAAGSFFRKAFEILAKPLVDPRLNMILITSFNEWNEDTSIEPLAASAATGRDVSQSGRLYTQGYQYEGFGGAYLRVVLDQTAAVAGRVAGAKGGPAAGAKVCAFRAGKALACARADSRGYWRLSRLALPPGPALLGLAEGGPKKPVVITPGRAAVGVDFNAGPE